MTPTDLDERTRRAITTCVNSIDELDALLHLARNRDRYVSADTIFAEAGIASRRAAVALEGLASRNLLDVRIAEDILYRLDPASPALRAMIEHTLDAARGQRSLVVRMLQMARTPKRIDAIGPVGRCEVAAGRRVAGISRPAKSRRR